MTAAMSCVSTRRSRNRARPTCALPHSSPNQKSICASTPETMPPNVSTRAPTMKAMPNESDLLMGAVKRSASAGQPIESFAQKTQPAGAGRQRCWLLSGGTQPEGGAQPWCDSTQSRVGFGQPGGRRNSSGRSECTRKSSAIGSEYSRRPGVKWRYAANRRVRTKHVRLSPRAGRTLREPESPRAREPESPRAREAPRAREPRSPCGGTAWFRHSPTSVRA